VEVDILWARRGRHCHLPEEELPCVLVIAKTAGPINRAEPTVDVSARNDKRPAEIELMIGDRTRDPTRIVGDPLDNCR
jgi:hypothetical protein